MTIFSWSRFPPICRGTSNLFSAPRLVWCFDYVVTTMSRTPLQLCTGCVYHSVLTSRWLSWRSACCTVSRHHIWISWFVSLSDLPGRRRLRSSSSLQLLVPPFRLTTVGRPSTYISSRCITTMELIVTWHPVISFSACFSSTSKNISLSSVLSRYRPSTVTLLRLCGLRNSSCYFSHCLSKNFHWHWHWQKLVYCSTVQVWHISYSHVHFIGFLSVSNTM